MEIFSSWILCASGAFLLTDDPGEAGKASKISLDTQQLLFDGVRRIDEMQHWRERIPTALVIISTTGKRPSSALEPLEQEALALIDGARSLEDVQRALAATEYDATRAIHRLIEKGLATAEAPARAGDEFEITATVETGDDGVEPAERAAQINAALAEVFDWINKTSDPGHFKLSMDSFLASESKKRPALKGLHLRADGTIDEALFLANLEIQKGSVADLEEVVSFAMFEAGELLDPERESKVERAVGKRLARIR
jgi:hypothetical protein